MGQRAVVQGHNWLTRLHTPHHSTLFLQIFWFGWFVVLLECPLMPLATLYHIPYTPYTMSKVCSCRAALKLYQSFSIPTESTLRRCVYCCVWSLQV